MAENSGFGPEDFFLRSPLQWQKSILFFVFSLTLCCGVSLNLVSFLSVL